MNNKHTPGPWHVTPSHNDGDDLLSVDAGERHITLHVIEAQEDISNARLIAAAPDLLAVAESLLAYIETYLSPSNGPLLDNARKVISGAKGIKP